MELFYVLFLMVISGCAYIKNKSLCNPVSILFLLWGMILYLSSKEYYSLYHTSDYVYGYIFAGLVSFLFGSIFIRLITLGKKKIIATAKNESRKRSQLIINYQLTYICALICLVFQLVSLMQLLPRLIQSGFSLSAVQAYLYDDGASLSGKSGILNAVSFLFVAPIRISVPILVSVDFWNGKRDKKLFGLGCLIVVLRIISTGGRQALIQFAISFLVSYIISRKRLISEDKKADKSIKNLVRENKRKIRRYIVLIVILFISATLSRTSSLIRHFYVDFAMQPYMLEQWMETADQTGLVGNGIGSWIGFSYPLFYILKNIFHIPIPSLILDTYNLTDRVVKEWIPIGSMLHANAYVTMFWYFYVDFGFAGIVTGMFLLGIAANQIYCKTVKNPCVYNVCHYCMLIILLVYSYGDLEIAKPDYALAVIFLRVILFRRARRQDGNG